MVQKRGYGSADRRFVALRNSLLQEGIGREDRHLATRQVGQYRARQPGLIGGGRDLLAHQAEGLLPEVGENLLVEIAVTGERFAADIVELISDFGIMARLNRRRGAFAIYLKSFDDIVTLLVAMGAARYAHTIEGVRAIKSARRRRSA